MLHVPAIRSAPLPYYDFTFCWYSHVFGHRCVFLAQHVLVKLPFSSLSDAIWLLWESEQLDPVSTFCSHSFWCLGTWHSVVVRTTDQVTQ